MRNGLLFLLLFFTLAGNAQGEASNWYFGQNAGLKFMPNGTVIPLSDGQLNTEEGCSSISDTNGNLLFYTDGKTVWDKNHIIMPNGTDLFGDSSSTQSGIIVPKPNNANIYYIFTVDEPHHENAALYPNGFSGTYIDPNSLNVPEGDDGFNNGLNYSIVDLSVTGTNGSIGDVVSKNNHLVTYNPDPNGEEIKYKCSEKITAISNPNTSSFWVITHFINKFYAFKVDGSGVYTNPVVSTIGSNIGVLGYRRNAIGYLKTSPNGEKIAIAHNQNGTEFGTVEYASGNVQLYDFDVNSGEVTNQVEVLANVMAYGIEFSSSSEKLYSTYRTANYDMELSQFNLLSNDVAGSKTVIHTQQNHLSGLQLAANNKVYCAINNQNSLSVINDPNADGLLCNFVISQQPLAPGKIVNQGLPPFITSFFFVPAIQFDNSCVNQDTSFEFTTSQEITSVAWNFGDGETSNALSPIHVYSSPGTYTVSVTVSGANGVGTNTREITIHPVPILNSRNVNLKQCDDDNDGFSAFNLNEVNALLVNNTEGLIISYHPTLQDTKDNLAAIINTNNYTNQTVSNETLFARVENANGCYTTAQINLQVSTTLIPAAFQKIFNECDDVVSGSNTDGIGTFDFSSVTPQIQALYPAGQLLDITYYQNLTDALAEQNAIPDLANFTNTASPGTQDIYVRVDSQVNNECLGLGRHITLNVEALPVAIAQTLKECDDNYDGIYSFDTSAIETNLLNGLTDVTVFYTDENGVTLSSPLPNPFVTTSQTLDVLVKNNFGLQCEYASTITFVVDDLPEAFAIPVNLTSLCDDEIDPTLQDGVVPFDTSTFQSTILGNQTSIQISYFDQNNVQLPSPLPNPFMSGSQTIKVELKNTLNPTCTILGNIELVVYPNPSISLIGNELICSDNPSFTKIIDAGLTDPSLQNEYTYSWFLDEILLADKTNYTLTVNQEGTYTVIVQNQVGCTSSRSIEVTASNSATIENIVATDLSDNNSITITVSGLGDYVYNLNGNTFQESEVFSGLIPGIYTIGVADVKGCNSVSETVYILGAPKYFTPNGDGYNDFWNIQFLDPSLNLKISIFDRFGKLLKLFNPKDSGWEGTYNGNPLPATDYWYVIDFESGRIVRGHFSLIR